MTPGSLTSLATDLLGYFQLALGGFVSWQGRWPPAVEMLDRVESEPDTIGPRIREITSFNLRKNLFILSQIVFCSVQTTITFDWVQLLLLTFLVSLVCGVWRFHRL